MTQPAITAAGEIRCEDLVRIFSAEAIEVQALQGLNLHVAPGDLTAIVGASGSGKSTLLTILSGLDTPTAGRASVGGVDLLTMTSAQRVHYQRRVVGFVWQQTSRNLLPYLTGAQNVAMPMALAGRDDPHRVSELLEVLAVPHCHDRLPVQMSGGEQQRVAIAVAVANAPQVLLADEPTGELDEATSADVLEAMRRVNEELGLTVLIVTHDPTVSEHVRRTIQIRDGRTSTEVLRRTETDAAGQEQHIAEEFAVLDRVGRMQLPNDFVHALELKDRVRLALEPDHVGVWRDAERPSGRDGSASEVSAPKTSPTQKTMPEEPTTEEPGPGPAPKDPAPGGSSPSRGEDDKDR